MDVKDTLLSLTNSSPGYDELPASIAKQCIDNYVVPLTYIINMSLIEGIFFRSELELANVVPIFKSGESDKVTNYRPISGLSFFSKIFEKIIYNYVINCMDTNDTIYKYQFGFRKKHSTHHAIITLVDKITSSLDSGDIIIGVFLFLKKAFDTVNHHILLKNLSIPKLDPLIELSILFHLVSVDLEYHDGWCALKSPRIRVSGVVRRCSIED